jgi:NAD(P)-dependent dehydrogenase (short-subunit alcohol dehydrogenase family)
VAAALPTAALTALACIELLAIGPDDIVLVNAAAGGVGLAYAQPAMARGAQVVGTAGPGNQDFLRSLGMVPLLYGNRLAGRDAVLAGLQLGLPPTALAADTRARLSFDQALAAYTRLDSGHGRGKIVLRI